MRKILSSVIIFAFILTCTLSVFADGSLKHDIYTYTVSGTEATITSVDDVAGKVTVPETIGEYTVTAIGKGAFGASEKITEVAIPDTVKSIGSTCFAYSTSIRTVRLSKGIASISDGMFYQCSALTGVSIPYGVSSIGANAFAMCPSLTSVTIPNSMRSIADDAFAGSTKVTFYCYLGDGAIGYTYATNKNIPTEELIAVFVNGEEIFFDQPPITDKKNFRTLIPLRGVLETMGATVEWYDDMEYAGISIGEHRILFKPYETFMRLDGKTKLLSSPGIVYNDRVMIPVRDVVEAVGGKITWDEHSKIVYIEYNI